MALTDQSTRIRSGEELDASLIDPYLKAHIPGLSGLPVISQFPGGASNLTYLLEYPEQEFVLRRPPFGHKAKSAHDICLLYTSPSPRDGLLSRMPSSA